MGMFCYLNPANQKQRYWTMSTTDAGIPAGWVLTSGSDGGSDEHQQVYKAGINSGGFPSYGDLTTNPTWPNGIMGGAGGGKPTG